MQVPKKSETTANYNSWPLGKLPPEFQRQEPHLIRAEGYEWDDPRDIVKIFEKKLAKYSGSKYAITVDCASNALFLCLKFRQVHGEVVIPARTYVSVPMQISHAGCRPIFEDLIHFEDYPVAYPDRSATFTRNSPL